MKNSTKLGIGISLFWLFCWFFYAYYTGIDITKMSLNELGDFVAGISAALAFLWLILGYHQQGEELSQNTKALKEHDESLKKQAESLKELAEATFAQVEETKRQALAYSRSIQPVFQISANSEHRGEVVKIIHLGVQPIFSVSIELTSSDHRLTQPVSDRIILKPNEIIDFSVINKDGTKDNRDFIAIGQNTNFKQSTAANTSDLCGSS